MTATDWSILSAKILVVCTANVCRSPTMARLLSTRLSGVDVQSRGVDAVVDQAMCATAGKWLQGRGERRPAHFSKPLTVADIRSSTLVLTATRWHRASVLQLRPSAVVRTHTMAETLRIIQWRMSLGSTPSADSDLGDRVLWLAEELHEYREVSPRPSVVDADDVPDPHNGAKHPAVLNSLLATAEQLATFLSGQPSP